MSAGDDNVFARWSRRKQAVRYGEAPAPVDESKAPDATKGKVKPVDQPVPAEPDSSEPLPSLGDLTADSDLSAFLRKGVPEALKSAAMRKMWSLDPAIRDHIGLSEYAWDFNQPGSMAGFGPLDANESVAEFLSTMSGGTRADLASAAAPSEAPQSLRQSADVPPEPHSSAAPDEAAILTEQPELLDPATRPELLRPSPAKIEAEPGVSEKPIASINRKRHGGAMPP